MIRLADGCSCTEALPGSRDQTAYGLVSIVGQCVGRVPTQGARLGTAYWYAFVGRDGYVLHIEVVRRRTAAVDLVPRQLHRYVIEVDGQSRLLEHLPVCGASERAVLLLAVAAEL